MEHSLLIEKAKEASTHSYSPYSEFKVGAALEDENGNVFTGCNVENLSFPAGVCAETNAISNAVSVIGPSLKIKKIAVYTPTESLTTPCGVCRQVISEFASNSTLIVCSSEGSATTEMLFSELFPSSPAMEGVKK